MIFPPFQPDTAATIGVVLRDGAVASANATTARAATAERGSAGAAPGAVSAAITAGRAALADEAATAPVSPTVERDRLKQRLEQPGQDLPARAVEARLTAAYGEDRPAGEIRAGKTAVDAAVVVPDRRLGLQRSSR